MESKLSSFFSTKIKIDSSNNEKGKIEIYFESWDSWDGAQRSKSIVGNWVLYIY